MTTTTRAARNGRAYTLTQVAQASVRMFGEDAVAVSMTLACGHKVATMVVPASHARVPASRFQCDLECGWTAGYRPTQEVISYRTRTLARA